MSSLFNQASLVIEPAVYETSKVYATKPFDGSGDLTFSRGSDIEATRIGADGLIHKAQVNLLLQSNSFSVSGTWPPSSASVTGGQADKDGGTTAWLLESTGINGRLNQTLSVNGVQTLSVYAKAGSVNFIRFQFLNITSGSAYFDLSNGTTATLESGLIDSSIESVGSGWYRVSATASGSVTGIRIFPAQSDGVADAGTVYIQDAQLNYGLVAQTYQETTTAAVVSGITNDMPRLNYDPANPTCPSLLLEPSRTNAITQSEFVDSWGVKTNISVVSNNGTSPEGVINASNIYPTTTGASFFYEGSITYTSGTTYTYSVFAKANGKDYLQIATSGASFSNQYCTFDLALGATDNNGFESVGIEDYGNGWWRCYVVETSISTASSRFVIGLVSNANAGRLSSVTADGTNGVLIYGVVSETGSYPTSYIPTYGSSATRLQDVGKAIYNPIAGLTQATLMVEYTQPIARPSGLNHIAGYRDNANADFYILQIGNSDSHELRWRGQNGTAVSLAVNIPEATYGLNRKVAFVKTNDKLIGYCNGVKLAEVSDGATDAFSTNTAEELDLWYSGFVETKNIKQLLLFPTALSDADAIALTSL